jgi:hypothetical protein
VSGIDSRRIRPGELAWWLGGFLVGLMLAALDGPAYLGRIAYALLGLAAGAGVGWVWRRVVGDEPARGLLAAMLVALALRMATALVLAALLPAYGNDVRHHDAGTFFPDAFVRDRTAFAIGRTETSLLDSFDSAIGDQYGTLLFLTAVVYRLFGPEVDRTNLPVAAAAVFGSLAVVWTWGFALRAFDRRVAGISAWFVALYPEAILLGSGAMREPFVMAGMAAALYGYGIVRAGAMRSGLGWIAGGCLLCLAISPPFGIAAAGLIGLAWLWEGRARGRNARWVILGLVGVGLAAVVLTVRAWLAVEGSPAGAGGILSWWLEGVAFELGKLASASGWIQYIFGQTPPWAHPFLATAYGLVQPFLPAALMDNTGVLLMQLVMIWRALGWLAVLPVLLYVPFASVRQEGWRSLPAFLTFVILVSAILISYRFAGDQWDSPRYRAALLPYLGILIGWAWGGALARRDRWLLWSVALVVAEILVLSWWYAGRYYHIPRLSLFRTLGIAGFVGVLLMLAAVAMERRRHRLA